MTDTKQTPDRENEIEAMTLAFAKGQADFTKHAKMHDRIVAAVRFGADYQAKQDAAEIERLRGRVDELEGLINTPETEDFIEGVKIEAAHQIVRWGLDHDADKTPWDWFWLIGYVSQKAAVAMLSGDIQKAKHHMVTTASVMLNWHKRTVAALKESDNG